MLISVHIPKTAGTAFGTLLAREFGPGLLRDYDDRPLSHGGARRIAVSLAQVPLGPLRLRGRAAVHGHFLPLKYLACRGDVVTWLRDPAQRIVSRYEHYRRDVAEGRPLQAVQGLVPGLALEEFIEIGRFRNTYAKYFRGFPLRSVRCFGFSEAFEDSLARMRRILGIDLGAPCRVNANPLKDAAPYAVSSALLARIERLNAEDYGIWRWARDREGS